MDTSKKIFQEEKENLNEIKRILELKKTFNTNMLKLYEGDISQYSRVDELERQNLIKDNNNLTVISNNPYHARMDIRYAGDDTDSQIYIGNKDLIIDNEPMIISWAAPVASVFNKFSIGKFKEKIHDKKRNLIIEGDINLKRRIEIENGELIKVISLGNINDETDEDIRLVEKIGDSKTDKLGSIVTTIQREQDEIVRQPIGKCVLVQGCAGSGKSSVAYHRLAQLIYNNELGEEEVLVIAPNRIFMNYTQNIMLELGGNFNVEQVTFVEFAKKLLGDDFKYFDSKPRKGEENINILITSDRYKRVIDKFIEYLDEILIPKDDIIIEGYKLVDYSEVKEIWDNKFKGYKINNKIEKFNRYIEEIILQKSYQYIIEEEKKYKNNLEVLGKVLTNQIQINELTKLQKEEWEIRQKRLSKTFSYVRGKYISSIKHLDIMETYCELVMDKELIVKISEGIFSDEEINIIFTRPNNVEYTHVDAIVALYLYCKMNDVDSSYRHIVIDECQDLSPIEVSIIESLTKSFTLTGDFNQRVNLYKTTTSYDYIVNLFNKYTYFNTYYLNKSFRNTNQITTLANTVMKEHFISKDFIPESFNRDGDKCELNIFKNIREKYKGIAKLILNGIPEGKTIGIILKNESDCIEVYYSLRSEIKEKIQLIIEGDEKLIDGINIIPVKLSKGIEFDHAIIADLDQYENTAEDIRLLYIAITRALNKVTLLSSKKEHLFENMNLKNCIEINSYKTISDEDLMFRETIKEIIVASFGEMPNSLKEAIESIDDGEKLTEVMIGINDCYSMDDIEAIIRELIK